MRWRWSVKGRGLGEEDRWSGDQACDGWGGNVCRAGGGGVGRHEERSRGVRRQSRRTSPPPSLCELRPRRQRLLHCMPLLDQAGTLCAPSSRALGAHSLLTLHFLNISVLFTRTLDASLPTCAFRSAADSDQAERFCLHQAARQHHRGARGRVPSWMACTTA
eukprot:6212908-Pleurochrysis_carterae.AAC.1